MSGEIAKRLCLGTAQLGSDYGVSNKQGRPDDRRCEAILSLAIEQGILTWDTAHAYGDAEQRIGRFLAGSSRRDDVRVVSKLSPPPADVEAAELSNWVMESCHESLQRLNTDRLYGYLLHDAATLDRFPNVWDALQALMDRGLVQRVGVSVYDEDEFRYALSDSRCDMIQFPMNVLDQRLIRSGLVAEAKRRGMQTFARSALLQGVFTMAPASLPNRLEHVRQPLEELRRVLAPFQLTPQTVALPFLMGHEDIDQVVIGVDNPRQLGDNVMQAGRPLPALLWEQLTSMFRETPIDVVEPRRWKSD